jgi:glycosyltransferase involved in cell wall biosynthesis
MVSGEYPPMKGGVGRYTHHLINALKKSNNRNIDVYIVTNSHKEKANTDISSSMVDVKNTIVHEDIDNTNDDNDGIFHGITKKGDRKNSDRLLDLVQQLKPDIVNIQYERGLYEIDTTIGHMFKRILHGSTLDKFYKECPVPTVSTLHTLFPYSEYKEYIKERALRKEGRFAFLPLPLRATIRKWVMNRRYDLLQEVVRLSSDIISPANTIRKIVKRGTVIYHGAEPAQPSLSAANKQEFRKEFGLPNDKRLLLAFGYVGSYKGFDILDNLSMPKEWSLVVKQNKHERGLEQPLRINNAINLSLGHIDDITLSKLFFACDAIIFPYRIVSVSGVLFDALAHGLPFVASNLEFFREFEEMQLGLTCNRNAKSFSDSITNLAEDYNKYKENVQRFNPKLRWSNIANDHIEFYSKLLKPSP